MPSSVVDVMTTAGLAPEGVVGWGEQVPAGTRGVYVVALTDESTSSTDGTLAVAPVSLPKIDAWLDVRPELRLDGLRPTAAELAERLDFPKRVGSWRPRQASSEAGSTIAHVRRGYARDRGEER